MNLLCKYYSNHVRLANAVQSLSAQPSFRFFCTKGMIVKNKKDFEVITDSVTLVVACVPQGTGKNSMMIITSDPDMRDKDGATIDTTTLVYDPVFYNLCLLLQEKYKLSKNPATVEFRGERLVTALAVTEDEDGEMQCTVRGTDGDLVVRGVENVKSLLGECQTLHSFRYISETPECQREVIVRRGRTDILREIARYLSRTVVLVSFLPDGNMLEQYVSGTGLLEVVTREDGTRIYKKLAGTRLRDADAFCIYQSAAKIEDILREQGRALHTDKKG